MSKKNVKYHMEKAEIEEELTCLCSKCREEEPSCALCDGGDDHEEYYCINEGEFHLCYYHHDKLIELKLL